MNPHTDMATLLKNLSPFSVCDAGPQGLLKIQACLCLREIPNHLGLKILTAQLCSCSEAMSMRHSMCDSQVKWRYPLSVSQGMKLYSEVASMT